MFSNYAVFLIKNNIYINIKMFSNYLFRFSLSQPSGTLIVKKDGNREGQNTKQTDLKNITGGRKMKKIITTTLVLSVIALFLNLNTATAADRHKVFEMGESGSSVSFPMTAEEIAAEDAEAAKLAAIREAKLKNPGERMRVYEMGESGHTVSFPLTAEEIAAEDANKDRPVSRKAMQSSETEKRLTTFEMAESGQIIEFSVSMEEAGSKDVVATRTNR